MDAAPSRGRESCERRVAGVDNLRDEGGNEEVRSETLQLYFIAHHGVMVQVAHESGGEPLSEFGTGPVLPNDLLAQLEFDLGTEDARLALLGDNFLI